MSLKSVLLSAPIRVGGAPASKKYEHGGDVYLDIKPPFIVIGRRVGGVFQCVGVPAGSVGHVEFVDVPEETIAPVDHPASAMGDTPVGTGAQADVEAPRGRKRKSSGEPEGGP